MLDKIRIPVWKGLYVRKDWVIRRIENKIFDDWEKYITKGKLNIILRELIKEIEKHTTIKHKEIHG